MFSQTQENKFKIPSLAHLAAGSTSSLISTILLQPLDVIKTKQQQLLINPTSRRLEVNTKYRGMFGTLCTVVREDGIRGLWRGTAPSLYRTVPGSGVYFFMLSNINPLLTKVLKSEGSLVALLSGFSARTLATITLMPFTVIKTRFEATGTNVYKNTFDALKTIALQERLRGLYSGLLPTILRDAPFSGIYFMFYSRIKRTLEKSNVKSKIPSPLLNLFSGLVAGTLATAITHPPDVIKTRLQTQFHFVNKNNSLFPQQQYKGTFHAIMKIYRDEGLQTFFRGFLPRMIRRTLLSAFTWTFYEEIKWWWSRVFEHSTH